MFRSFLSSSKKYYSIGSIFKSKEIVRCFRDARILKEIRECSSKPLRIKDAQENFLDSRGVANNIMYEYLKENKDTLPLDIKELIERRSYKTRYNRKTFYYFKKLI